MQLVGVPRHHGICYEELEGDDRWTCGNLLSLLVRLHQLQQLAGTLGLERAEERTGRWTLERDGRSAARCLELMVGQESGGRGHQQLASLLFCWGGQCRGERQAV